MISSQVVHVSCPDDTIVKAITVPETADTETDLQLRKKEVAAALPGYRWEIAKALEALSTVSRSYDVTDPGSVEKCIPEMMAFLAATQGDAGLKGIKGA